jgi:glutathione synthase/RimK-type ligase-like ATP-grasp enzyme
MIIGIHHNKGSFSDRWIEYCQINNIQYKLVNCYNTEIIKELADCDILMWHHHHGNYKDLLFAKQLLYTLELSGIKVFPDFKTVWHFDDKIGQKYLLESIHASFIPSYIFYDKKDALMWLTSTDFPKVFKLRNGAGAVNVKLIKSQAEGRKYIKKAFKNGFPVFDSWNHFKEVYFKFSQGKASFKELFSAIGRFFIKPELASRIGPQKGYIYFQDFIPNNKFDIRIVVIGNKAFGIKRMVRKNDFRASGSGNLIYDRSEIPLNCVEAAFAVNIKLDNQCIAFDFVINNKNEPVIIEISYGFSMKPYDSCPGYWKENLEWVEAKFNPQYWQVENIIKQIKK